MKRIFITDCEGPISKNDNAFELTANFIPNGEKLFTNLSKYDDVLADTLKKPGYSAGSTLKLILPFFKAYGVTDKQMEEFSASNILLIADTQLSLHHIQTITEAYIVSTSYEHYIKALCETLDFPYKNTYCTKVNLDKCLITPQEKERLKELSQEIVQMKQIEIPKGATNPEDFSNADQETVRRLDEIFWNLIPKMFIGKSIRDVVTVGGEQKAESIREAAKRENVELADVMYVGDSITDVEAFKLVRANDGLTVSFNGNGYAVENAEVAVISESNAVTAIIAELFCRFGKQKVEETLQNWDYAAIKSSGIEESLLRKMSADGFPKAKIVTTQNMESLVKESSDFRKKVRGVAVGKLG